ncbi:MAG: hypothetical protein KJZ87_20500 [Thermoguttaceae bacterium]|nr:hypothetical protein [Thermoguttaceae bacterium]
MSLELRWLASHSASCFHAAWAFSRGPLADAQIEAAIREPAESLRHEIVAAGICEEGFWRHIVPLSAGIENNRQLADLVVRKTIGHGKASEATTLRLAGWIAEVEAAVQRAVPDLVDRVAQGGEWIKEQWSSLGPATLSAIARRTDANIVVPAADVILVWPACGGDGAAHLVYNNVRLEAVATDPVAELPEVLRLAWLIAQLNLEVPIFSEGIPPRNLPLVAACAMVPPVLAAAGDLDLVYSPDSVLPNALERWRVAGTSGSDLAPVISDWWQTYLDAQPPWHIALAALDRMLSSAALEEEPEPSAVV